MNTTKLIDAIILRVIEIVKNEAPKIVTGRVTADESVANLYAVNIDGMVFRYIRKMYEVTVTVGDDVIILKSPSVPMTILGHPVGDITLGA